MVTFAQAQERADRWVNADVPGYQRRDVRIREFDLGFVAWSEDREAGPVSDGGRTRLVIARDSGEMTLWPGLPVDEVIRCYEEAYGAAPDAAEPAAPAPERVDLEATSFLLTPPEWLQEAADRRGVPDHRSAAAGGGAPAASAAGSPWDAADTSSSDAGAAQQPPATVFAPPLSGSDDDAAEPPGGSSEARTALMPEGSSLPRTAVAPAIGDEPGAPAPPPPAGPPPAAPPPPVPGQNGPDAPPSPPPAPGAPPAPGTPGAPGGGQGGGVHHAATMLAGPGQGPGTPPPPAAPGPPGAGDIADADTSRAPRGSAPGPSRSSRGGPSVPPPPGAPGTPGARSGGARKTPSGPGAPGTPGGGYVPTQMVSADDVASQGGGGSPASGGSESPGGDGGVHQAATMLAGPGQGPGTPPPPAAPGPPGAPGVPGPPQAPGAPPGAPPAAPGAPAAYGYPQQPSGLPTVGPGYMAVLRYRAPDGSEQQLIRRSAPGAPHPEWQILHELHTLNVPPQQVLELHTELESCDLPGGYCARMIRETWPQVRVSHTAAYGSDHASRQQGMQHLIEHQGELHQVADAPPRAAPQRVPLPPPHQIQPAPPIPPDGIGHELLQAFGPQGVFRFDQRAVSRQGVPDIVGQVLVWAGVPVDCGPFFWGQAQPGRPVPTLAELAQERGVQPAADAGSYLVMGNDFGRQLCVQYGTAHIVAVPLEGGQDGQPATPQFVSTGLPEFVRSLALLGRMWRLRLGLNPEQAGRWTVDFQTQLAMLDPAALSSPENWWSVLLEQMWDGLF